MFKHIRQDYHASVQAWALRDYKKTIYLLRQAKIRTEAFILYLEKRYLKEGEK